MNGKKGDSIMKAFGYSVRGNRRALISVLQVVEGGYELHWESLNIGDIYWAENGEGFRVKINHKTKIVMLNEEDQSNITEEELYDIN